MYKNLISKSNDIRKISRSKNSESKQSKVAVEYVRLCGYSANGDRATECQNGTRLTLNEIASQLGTSKRELQRALNKLCTE